MEMRGNDRQSDGVWYECHPNVTSETRIQSQFRGLFKTSPGTIHDAEENQHGGIVASAALEQMMRRSIETGLCKPWQPLTRMDFVVLEMDNTIGLEVLFATAIFSHKVKSSTTFHTLQTHPVCQRIRIQCRPTIRTHHTAIIPSQPIKFTSSKHPNIAYKSFPFLPSIPTSPINPFHFSAKQHTVTYKTFLLFEFPCSQHVSNFRYDFSLFFLYKQTQNISKDMTSTSGTTNVLR